MKSGVRIIKRVREEITQRVPPVSDEKTARQSEREVAGTVKGWISEWELRRRLDAQSAYALMK